MRRFVVRGSLFAVLFYSLLSTNYELAFSVEVEPARLELAIPADEPTQGQIDLTNHTPKPVEVRISAGPYRFSQPDLKLPSAQTWISFEPDRITLGPNASTQISYRITPPANVMQDTAGEYLAAILVDELPAGSGWGANEETGEGAKITVVPRFALPVYLKIRGRELIQVEVEQVSVEPGPSPGLLRVETLLKNRGTVHLRPTGTLAILRASGEMVHSRPLGKTAPLLPTATLKIPTVAPLPSPGNYRAVVTLELGGDTADLIQKEASFEVIPSGEIR